MLSFLKIPASRIKRGPILIAVLSLFFGLQIAALAAPYDDGWIYGSTCPTSDPAAYVSCLDALCHARFDNSADKCAFYGCHNGGFSWYENNVACNEKVHPLACPFKEAIE